MRAPEPRKQAFTLIELLVVMAIVALITGLALPMVSRMGFSTGRTAEIAARELFTKLRAAKIYAGTHNVETALAYFVIEVADSETGDNVDVISAVAVVRRLKREELDRTQWHPEFGVMAMKSVIASSLVAAPCDCSSGDLSKDYDSACDDANEAFVTIRTREGKFQSLYGEAAILNPPADEAEAETMAMAQVLVFDNTNMEIIFSEEENRFFYAHVFSPAGTITPDSTLQRIGLRVGLLPDNDPDKRFFQGREIATIVSLYTATGRIKVSS